MSPAIGRRQEAAVAVNRLRSGARAVVLDGVAGSGKSTCLTAVVEQVAAGATVRVARLTALDPDLPFGALSQIVGLSDVESGSALASALGRGADRDVGVSVGEVAYAFVDWLSGLDAPIIAVDDVHWIDHSSATAFAAGIRSGSARWLLTRRSDTDPLLDVERLTGADGVTTVRLRPLTAEAIAAIAQDITGRRWSPAAIDHLSAVSGANPLYVAELVELYPAGLPDELDRIPTTAERLYKARLDAADASVIEVLGMIAIAPDPTLRVLAAAAREIDLEQVLRVAANDGLVRVDAERVTFRHPLVGESVRARLDGTRTARLHRELAKVTDAPDARMFHLGLGTVAPDAAIASMLEGHARVLIGRGAPQRAVQLLRRSIQLTPVGIEHHPDVCRRQLSAGTASTAIGDWPGAVDLLEPLLLDEDDRHWQGLDPDDLAAAGSALVVATERTRGPEAAEHMAATLLRRPVPDALRATSIQMQVRLRQLVDLRDGADLAAGELPPLEHHPDPRIAITATVAHRSARYLVGEPVELDGLLDRVAPFADASPQGALWHLTELLAWDDRFEEARSACRLLLDLHPGLPERSHTLGLLARVERQAGKWSTASELLDEVVRLSAAGGDVAALYDARDRAWLAAARGNDAEAESLAAPLLAAASSVPPTVAVDFWGIGGFVALAARRFDVAIDRLGEAAAAACVARVDDTRAFDWRLDYVEALAATGRAEQAADVAAALGRAAVSTESVGAGLRAAIARVAIAPRNATAADLSELSELISGRTKALRPFDIGRANLTIARAHLRSGRRRRAADALDAAEEVFGNLGAAAFGRLVESERQRLGSRREAETTEPTGAELRVIELVCQGRTNRQIAQELAISVRTVESHLSRVYRRLHVGSRTELVARRLHEQPSSRT
jgi:DNA-binding CsgD family transcriptional regulator